MTGVQEENGERVPRRRSVERYGTDDAVSTAVQVVRQVTLFNQKYADTRPGIQCVHMNWNSLQLRSCLQVV